MSSKTTVQKCEVFSVQVGIKCVRLEGSMALEQRDKMIAAFTDDPDVTVFLMSLKAGGVALNLTAASHVMLMDPWWNPAVEQQACSFLLSASFNHTASKQHLLGNVIIKH